LVAFPIGLVGDMFRSKLTSRQVGQGLPRLKTHG